MAGERLTRLEQVVKEAAAEPAFLAVHRQADGRVLAMEKDLDLKMRAKNGAPFLDLHPVDLQKILTDESKSS